MPRRNIRGFITFRIEYTQDGVRKEGKAGSVQGARSVLARHEGPEPARIWWGEIEVFDDGRRFVPLDNSDPGWLLKKINPFPGKRVYKKRKKKRKPT
jgi:hypothetical protein